MRLWIFWTVAIWALMIGQTFALDSSGGDEDHAKIVGNILASCKIHNDGDAVVVPVTIGDMQSLFLLSTGSKFTIVDAKYKLSLSKTPAPEGGRASEIGEAVEFYKSPRLVFNDLQITPPAVLVHDFSSAGQGSGLNIRGVLNSSPQ